MASKASLQIFAPSPPFALPKLRGARLVKHKNIRLSLFLKLAAN